MPGVCEGPPEKDHIRASGGLGIKSRSTLDNGVLLCSNTHHPLKTREGKRWRPVLIEYVARKQREAEHAHVELVYGCADCDAIARLLRGASA